VKDFALDFVFLLRRLCPTPLCSAASLAKVAAIFAQPSSHVTRSDD
jgi:hypothetical protein